MVILRLRFACRNSWSMIKSFSMKKSFRPPTSIWKFQRSYRWYALFHLLNHDVRHHPLIHSDIEDYISQEGVEDSCTQMRTYRGEGDRFQFRSFFLSFENTFGCRTYITSPAKLQYLKAHLSDFAQTDIEHIFNVYENYSIAIKILKDLYLNKPFIIGFIVSQDRLGSCLEWQESGWHSGFHFWSSSLSSWTERIQFRLSKRMKHLTTDLSVTLLLTRNHHYSYEN